MRGFELAVLALVSLSGVVSSPGRSGSRFIRQLNFDQELGSGVSDLEAMPSEDSFAAPSNGDSFEALLQAVPGNPGQDYPVYSVAPLTGFDCQDKLNGGYYADPEASCQSFHICISDGAGGLAKHSFLCPNGTVFNQNYFICDWWFNFDCAEAESLYSRNDEIRAEQEANIGAVSDEDAAAGAGLSNYGAPQNNDIAAYDELPAYDDVAAYDELPAEDIAAYDYAAVDEAAPLDNYGAAPVDEAVPVFEESAAAAPAGAYGAPAAEEEERAARRFRGRAGRRNNRRNNRNGRSRSGRRLSSRRSNSRRAGRNSRRNGRRSGRNFRG